MLKSFKKRSRQIHSIFTIFLLLFQNIVPLFLLPSPAFAATTQNQNISQVTLAFNQDRHELTLQGQADENVNYLITYQNDNKDFLQEAVTGKAESINNHFEESIYLGTCSDVECIPNDIDHGTLSFDNSDYEADFNIENNILWLNHNNVSTVNKVTTGTTYVSPQSDQVTVTFTSLPDNPGTLSIEKVILSEEQVKSLGALSNIAYDITSSMKNGTFEYNLTLPLPENAKEHVKVVYANDINGLNTGEELTNTIEGNEIKAGSVDHFTVFVVTSNPGADCSGGIYAAGVCYDNLQTAVDDASSGDTIDILSDITVGHRVDLNKALTIDGHGFTISATFDNLPKNNSNNASLGIFEDNTTIKNLVVDGNHRTNLHGINVYIANNILLDNVTVLNNNAGVVVNGSIVTANNITTSGNNWGGINIDQGTNVTTEAKLIVTGSSSHDEATHLWLDDITKNVSVDDTVGQYTYVDHGNTRVYTFKDKTNPVVTDIKMFVNGIESTFMRPGDLIRVEANITDTGSGMDKVRLLAKNASSGGYIDSGYFVNTTGDKYVREFTFPADGKYIDLHTPITTAVNGLRFYIKAYDKAENYTNSPATNFTYDKGIPLMSDIKMYVSENGSSYIEKSFVKPGDFVRIEVIASDSESGIKDVEFRITSKSNAYVAPRSYISSPISDNTYRFEYQVPTDGKYINTHGLMSEILNDHTFWARATDNVGNYNHGISEEFTYDNTNPIMPVGLKLIGKDGNEYQCSDYSLRQPHVPMWNNNLESDFSHYEYSSFHPSGAQGLNEKILTVPKLQNSWMPPIDGTYGFAVRAVDQAGNKSNWSLSAESLSGSCQISYDSEAPSTPEVLGFLSPSLDCGSITNINSTTVDWSDSIDSGSGFASYEYFIDYPKPDGSRGEWTTTRATSQYGGSLNEGTHNIKVRAKDILGNTSEWSNTCSITTDWQAPVTTLTSPSNDDETNKDILIEGSSTDINGVSEVNLYYSVAGEDNWQLITTLSNTNSDEPFSFSYDWTPSTEGSYDIKAAGTDNAGNIENSAYVYGITYDTTAPIVTWNNPSNLELVDGIVNLNATCDGGFTESTYINFWWWKSSEGQTVVEARDSTPKQYNRVSRNNLNGGTVNGNIFSYNINVTDEDIIQSTYNWTGEWKLRAACKDSAGNYAHSQIDFNVDHIKPTSTITNYGLSNGGEVQTATFSGLIEGTASDDHSGVDHVLLSISHLEFGADEIDTQYWDATSSAFVSTTSTFRAVGTTTWDYQLSKIPEGIYKITSHAVDVAGNVENTYSIKVIFDKTIPEVILTIDPSLPDGEKNWYKYTNPTVTLGASDNYSLDHIEYQWNSTTETWTTYTSPTNLPSEGSHIFYYRSIDTIGNISDLGVKEIKYDTTNPAGEPLEVKVENITSNTADASWKSPEDDSDVTFYRVSWKHENGTSYGVNTGKDDFFHKLDNLYDGVWTLSVRARDDAGNFTEKKINFRVGPGTSSESDEGTVLGVTSGDGIGGIYTPIVTSLETVEEKNQDKPKIEEEIVVLSEEGDVLGATACNPWSQYLPLILLSLQLITIVGFELIRRDSNSLRIITAIGITLITIGLFYFLKNNECFAEESWLTTVTKWFTLLSIGTGIAAKMISHTFIDEG